MPKTPPQIEPTGRSKHKSSILSLNNIIKNRVLRYSAQCGQEICLLRNAWRLLRRGGIEKKLAPSVTIKSEEETFPRLIQTGENASSYLMHTQTFAAEAGSTLHLKMAGRRSKGDSLRLLWVHFRCRRFPLSPPRLLHRLNPRDGVNTNPPTFQLIILLFKTGYSATPPSVAKKSAYSAMLADYSVENRKGKPDAVLT